MIFTLNMGHPLVIFAMVGLLPQVISMEKISTCSLFLLTGKLEPMVIRLLKKWSNWNVMPALALVAVVGCIRPPWQRLRFLGWATCSSSHPAESADKKADIRRSGSCSCQNAWNGTSHLISWLVKPLKMRLQTMGLDALMPLCTLLAIARVQCGLDTGRFQRSRSAPLGGLKPSGKEGLPPPYRRQWCQPSWNTF